MYEMDMGLVSGISKPMTRWGIREIKSVNKKVRGFGQFTNNVGLAAAERAFLAAIIYRALMDLQSASQFERSDCHPKIYRRDAIRWFLSNEIKGDEGSYTFAEICIYLDLDPKSIRTALRSKGLLEI